MLNSKLKGVEVIKGDTVALGLLEERVCPLYNTDLAPLDVPVGFDAYSYGLRDVSGQKVHMSRPRTFMPSFGTGDVIGMHISLPPLKPQKNNSSDVFRDRIPIRFKGQLYFEQPDYIASKEMDDLMNPVLPPQSQLNPLIPAPRPTFPTLPGSFIKVYKNGVLRGTAFENLFAFLPPDSQIGGKDLDDGMLGYYPAISVFHGGIVTLNFGPEYLCPPQGLEGNVRPTCERYQEMLAEDAVWDLIDEMEWEADVATMDTAVGVPIGTGPEIKELADDEWT
jgi:COMPASS component BRE2